MILLDTAILTLLLAGHEGLKNRVAQPGPPIAITTITRIEVLQGRFAFLLKAADGAELRQAVMRLEKSERDLEEFIVIPVDDRAADEFDTLRKNKKVKKIGRADLLIACIALANNATLITRNKRHFQQVPGLKIENWAD